MDGSARTAYKSASLELALTKVYHVSSQICSIIVLCSNITLGVKPHILYHVSCEGPGATGCGVDVEVYNYYKY